jgi:hypothetical protein
MQLTRTIIIHFVFIILNILALSLPFASFLFFGDIDFSYILRNVFKENEFYIYICLVLLFSVGCFLIISIITNLFYILHIISNRNSHTIFKSLPLIFQTVASILLSMSLVILYNTEYRDYITIGSATFIVYITLILSIISIFFNETPETPETPETV